VRESQPWCYAREDYAVIAMFGRSRRTDSRRRPATLADVSSARDARSIRSCRVRRPTGIRELHAAAYHSCRSTLDHAPPCARSLLRSKPEENLAKKRLRREGLRRCLPHRAGLVFPASQCSSLSLPTAGISKPPGCGAGSHPGLVCVEIWGAESRHHTRERVKESCLTGLELVRYKQVEKLHACSAAISSCAG